MKKDQEKLEKQLTETQAENRKLQDPLQKVCYMHAVCASKYLPCAIYPHFGAGERGGGRATETAVSL